MDSFPVDDTTLILLAAACEMNDDTGQTHLHDFLDMGSEIKSMTLLNEDEVEAGGTPIYEVEHEDGCIPYSPHDAIRALVAEVQRLRGLLP